MSAACRTRALSERSESRRDSELAKVWFKLHALVKEVCMATRLQAAAWFVVSAARCAFRRHYCDANTLDIRSMTVAPRHKLIGFDPET